MLTRALRRVRRSADAGITLAELVVTMGLLSIVSALALTTFIGTSNSSNQTTEVSFAAAGARTAMSAWTGFLQVAVVPDVDPAVRNLAITATTLSFNAQLNNLPNCSAQCSKDPTTTVLLELKNGQLVQTLTRGSTVQTSSVVPSGVAAPSDGCLFHAYAADGTDFTCKTLTAADTALVSRIDIGFTVTPLAGPVQTFTSSAKLPGGAT